MPRLTPLLEGHRVGVQPRESRLRHRVQFFHRHRIENKAKHIEVLLLVPHIERLDDRHKAVLQAPTKRHLRRGDFVLLRDRMNEGVAKQHPTPERTPGLNRNILPYTL